MEQRSRSSGYMALGMGRSVQSKHTKLCGSLGVQALQGVSGLDLYDYVQSCTNVYTTFIKTRNPRVLQCAFAA